MISDRYKANFDTLCRAIRNDDVVVVECFDKVLKETVVVVCAVNFVDGVSHILPFAQLYEYDPRERLVPAIEPISESDTGEMVETPKANLN